MGSVPVNFLAMAKAAFLTGSYPLANSAILDSGSTIHIFNKLSRFKKPPKMAAPSDVVWAGEHPVKIEGYGSVDVKLNTPSGTKFLTLHNVAFCPTFACNIISKRQLERRGIWWDTRENCLRYEDESHLADLTDQFDQYVVEYIPEGYSHASFVARTRRINSWTARADSLADAMIWHLRLGHPGPRVLEHLVNSSRGAKLKTPKIKGITTIQCDGCGLGKARRRPHRQPRDREELKPGDRISLDLHEVESGRQDFRYQLLATDRFSGMMWDYYLANREADSIVKALTHLYNLLQTQYNIRIKAFESDNEFAASDAFLELCHERGIRPEPSAPHTPAQNGGGERSGGVIKGKGRAMSISSKLPVKLWPEIYKSAVYLYNRSPKEMHSWKSPIQRFLEAVSEQDGVAVSDKRPWQGHLKRYGCKAYAMTVDAQEGNNKRQRLNPRAFLGYLVGYDSTNIYRIWNPVTNSIVRTRDVTFNENEVFPGTVEGLKNDLAHVDLERLKTIISRFSEADDTLPDIAPAERAAPENEVAPQEEDAAQQLMDLEEFPSSHPATEPEPPREDEGVTEVGEVIMDTIVVKGDTTSTLPDFYPTPPASPPGGLLAAAFAGLRLEDGDSSPSAFEPWQAAFHAGTLSSKTTDANGNEITRAQQARATRGQCGSQDKASTLTRAEVTRLSKLDRLTTLHASALPPVPKWHTDLERHPLGDQFIAAEKEHLESHRSKGSWREIPRRDPAVRFKQVLDCMWVYTYKFNKSGQFVKCKARVVARGDQQKKDLGEINYAATLASRSLRTVLATAARFDLELVQFDAVNAFVNAKLDDTVFMEMPMGHRKAGTVVQLQKALYGLRKSPLLWQRELTLTLQKLGFKTVPHEPCVMIRKQVIVFFYVDDIVIAYPKKRQSEMHQAVAGLKAKYDLTGGHDLRWFLGMEIHRDRTNKLLWLAQTAYIEKIANLTDSEALPLTPMSAEELFPFNGTATAASMQRYQRKVGSILYAAIITRPDIAFAVSRLARFNQNPGPEHHKAADRVLRYLYATRYHALQLGGGDTLVVASDASFADNSVDRKSSQGYAISLFGGLIAWRASKQTTVTTSTTEAELLALAQAAKEGMFVQRLVCDLSVHLDEDLLTIQCDNTQTIRLVDAEIATLNTRLRHVDIHNMWLRQEAQCNRIKVIHVPSQKMIADGLTKALSADNHGKFVEMINVVSIEDRITARATAVAQLEEQNLLPDQHQGIHHETSRK
jgi:hypothetical protein